MAEVNHIKDQLNGFHNKAITIQRSFRCHQAAFEQRQMVMNKVFWEKEKIVLSKQLMQKKTK